MSGLLTGWNQMLIGFLLGAFASWFFTYIYYRKSSREAVEAANDLKVRIAQMKEESDGRNTIDRFEKLIKESTWSLTNIDGMETWVCDNEQTFQIQLGKSSRRFSESWTEVYPDPVSSEYSVTLMISGSKIRELTFVSADGGRIFVPRPNIQSNGGFFWDRNSLEFKVSSVVGNYYIYNDIEGVAERSNIRVVS